jgi:hypothetical protein
MRNRYTFLLISLAINSLTLLYFLNLVLEDQVQAYVVATMFLTSLVLCLHNHETTLFSFMVKIQVLVMVVFFYSLQILLPHKVMGTFSTYTVSSIIFMANNIFNIIGQDVINNNFNFRKRKDN